jgi:hypothetical protein
MSFFTALSCSTDPVGMPPQQSASSKPVERIRKPPATYVLRGSLHILNLLLSVRRCPRHPSKSLLLRQHHPSFDSSSISFLRRCLEPNVVWPSLEGCRLVLQAADAGRLLLVQPLL